LGFGIGDLNPGKVLAFVAADPHRPSAGFRRPLQGASRPLKKKLYHNPKPNTHNCFSRRYNGSSLDAL